MKEETEEMMRTLPIHRPREAAIDCSAAAA